jgi:hypothetical protein
MGGFNHLIAQTVVEVIMNLLCKVLIVQGVQVKVIVKIVRHG